MLYCACGGVSIGRVGAASSPSWLEPWRPYLIGVVWTAKDETAEVAEPVLRENSVSFVRLSDGEAARYRGELGRGDLWYRGAGVNALSKGEAATIVGTAVRYALESKLITPDEAAKIRTDVPEAVQDSTYAVPGTTMDCCKKSS